MTSTMSKTSTNEKIATSKPTHIVIVTLPEEGGRIGYNKPTPFFSLPDATKWCKEFISGNPGAQCDIYQLRTEMKGEVVVHESHYNN